MTASGSSSAAIATACLPLAASLTSYPSPTSSAPRDTTRGSTRPTRPPRVLKAVPDDVLGPTELAVPAPDRSSRSADTTPGPNVIGGVGDGLQAVFGVAAWVVPLRAAHPQLVVHAANSAGTLRDPAAPWRARRRQRQVPAAPAF